MTFKEYWLLNKPNIQYGVKLIGAILSSICFLFVLSAFFFEGLELYPVRAFLYCIVVGNALGTFMILLWVNMAYRDAKQIISFYHSIPDKTKEKYDLKIVVLHRNSHYSLKEFKIVNDYKDVAEKSECDNDYKFMFDCLDNKSKRITLAINVEDAVYNSDFLRYTKSFEKNFPKQQISLNGYGLVKTISSKQWKKMTDEDIDNITKQLVEIAEKEGFLTRMEEEVNLL